MPSFIRCNFKLMNHNEHNRVLGTSSRRTRHMHRAIKIFLLLTTTSLAACATDPSNMQPGDLRRQSLLQAEHVVELDFPQVQAALFKHEAACGSAPKFQLQRGETSYGWLIQKDSPDDNLNQAIVAELTLLEGSWRQGFRTRIDIYSYYQGSEVKARIRRLLVAVLRPGDCDPDAVPFLPIDPEERKQYKLIDSGA